LVNLKIQGCKNGKKYTAAFKHKHRDLCLGIKLILKLMDEGSFFFMVEFTMPSVLSERFMSRIPEQRATVSRLFSDGKLVSYGVSIEDSRIWAVFVSNTEGGVEELVRSLPLTRFTTYKIHLMNFYNLISTSIPAFSIN
jgi:hypothetical protein